MTKKQPAARKVSLNAKAVAKSNGKKTTAKEKLAKKMIRAKQAAKTRINRKLENQKNEERIKQAQDAEERRVVGELLENRIFLNNVKGSAGNESVDILRSLVKSPQTDEGVAESLGLKVNDVRRMLNVMNGYSIVRYDVNKDEKGWLIFKWRIDKEKLTDYVSGLEATATNDEPVLPGDCNDFFMCKKCYNDEKVIVPFDTAFESAFTCGSCGKPYAILNREQTVALFKETANVGVQK